MTLKLHGHIKAISFDFANTLYPLQEADLERTSVLGVEPHEVVHGGDDWEADVIGAMRAGLSAIYTTRWRDEPDAYYGREVTPLAEIGHIQELL